MRQFEVIVNDPVGIHARPAGLLVKEATKYESEITIEHNNKTADCKKIFAVMGLCAKYKDNLIIRISGIDEKEAEENLRNFFNNTI